MLCYLCRSSLFHEVYQVYLIPGDNFRRIVCVIVWRCGWSHRAVFWSGYHGHVIRLPDTQLYNCVVGQSTRLISLYACSCCVSVPFLLLFLVPFILHMTHFHIYAERALVAFRFHFSFISPAFSLHMSLFHCSSGTNVSICTNQKSSAVFLPGTPLIVQIDLPSQYFISLFSQFLPLQFLTTFVMSRFFNHVGIWYGN